MAGTFTSADGVDLLLDAGLERRLAGPDSVDIRSGPDQPWSRRKVLRLGHSPSPSEVSRDLRNAEIQGFAGIYYVILSAGDALSAIVKTNDRISYGALGDEAVALAGRVYRTGLPTAATATSGKPGRPAWGRYAIMRLLALSPEPLRQADIARRIGVSEAAVSIGIKRLSGRLQSVTSAWRAVDRGALWDDFLTEYPGPRGLATYWLALDEPVTQLARAQRASQAAGEPFPLVSGDFAADYYAAWRRPTKLIAYVSRELPLQQHGFAPVRAADASLELRIPADPTIAAMAGRWETSGVDHDSDHLPHTLVDPLIAAWDMTRTTASDVKEAVDRLRTRSLDSARWW